MYQNSKFYLHDKHIMVVSVLFSSIVYKHWPDTCEFITPTVEL